MAWNPLFQLWKQALFCERLPPAVCVKWDVIVWSCQIVRLKETEQWSPLYFWRQLICVTRCEFCNTSSEPCYWLWWVKFPLHLSLPGHFALILLLKQHFLSLFLPIVPLSEVVPCFPPATSSPTWYFSYLVVFLMIPLHPPSLPAPLQSTWQESFRVRWQCRRMVMEPWGLISTLLDTQEGHLN